MNPLRALLNGDRLEQLARLDTLLELPCFAPAGPADTPQDRYRRTYDRLRALGRAGGGTLALYRDRAALLTACEWAGTTDPALLLAALVHFGVVTSTLVELGHPAEALDPLIADLDRMDAVGTILITELGSGSSHLAAATEARYRHADRSFTLHTPHPGATKFMPSAALPDQSKIAVVYARLLVGDRDHGVFPFAVRLRRDGVTAPGVRVTALPPTSVVPLDYALIGFDATPVPYGAWLRDSARITPDGTFEDPLGDRDSRLVRSLLSSAYASAAAATGQAAAARAAVAIALRYATGRTTMGRLAPELPVLEYRTQQEPLYRALAQAYATTFLVEEERQRFVARPGAPAGAGPRPTWAPWSAAHRDLALAKAWTSRTLEQVTAVCRQRCGAQGILSANRISDHEDLARIFHAAAGDTLLILLDAGKSLLADPPPDPPPAAAFDPDDPATAIRLARLRERALHRELTHRLPGPEGKFGDWNPLLPGLVELALAHTERVVLERFRQRADTLTDPAARQALAGLHRLAGLDGIEDRLGWHLEHGSVTPAEAALVHRARPGTLAAVHAHLPALLDALALPTARLGAPIAEPDWLDAVLRGAGH
ncbi:acyl-CoA dehydrogenase [Kitasatospora kazusensis]|uniref:Acyl-CoA dehydrogenase n=1 Tax=Kitasatospora kazusensis TaxID=407974 RepID=A0ABP5KTI6_9ACTN